MLSRTSALLAASLLICGLASCASADPKPVRLPVYPRIETAPTEAPHRPIAKTTPATAGRRYSSAIQPYVSFLRGQKTRPVDYILGLFQKHDIVILCERWHSEATQWDMIYELTSDPRFIDKVGVVYTEYGPVVSQSLLDELLRKPGLPQEQAREKLLRIYRNMSIWPLWNNTNFYDYLTKVCELNRKLPRDRGVRLYFSDIPWDWAKITTTDELAKAFTDAMNRDRIIAERVIDDHRRKLAEGRRRKCLVIFNYRHAFSPILGETNAAAYIFNAFPGHVANVLINTVRPVAASSDAQADSDLIHEGKWDAAFEVVGNPDIGFDLKGSPFGDAAFDLFPFDPSTEASHYGEVFTGFVFYKPLVEHREAYGVPGLIDKAFYQELGRRHALAPVGSGLAKRYEMSDSERDIEWAAKQGIPWEAISNVTDVKSFPLSSRQKMQIARWLVADGP